MTTVISNIRINKKILSAFSLAYLIITIISCSENKPDIPAIDLKLDKSAVTLKRGKTVAVTIESGNGGYSVATKDEKIATASVNENIVTIQAVGEGMTTITVTDKQQKKAIINVIVPYASLKLDKSAVTLKRGKTIAVTIESGNGGYSVTTKDEKIATASVNENIVTIQAVGEGVTVITIIDSRENTTNINVNVVIANSDLWEIKNGKFYDDDEWIFLKIAKPLRDFSNASQVDKLISELDILQSKRYNTIEINCYWHHFDHNGDGIPDKSLAPLNWLINAIYKKGMYPCLSLETYAVGGGTIPSGFWDRNPDAYAIDDKGNRVKDTEYGFGSSVVSIFHSGYRSTVHEFIKNMAKGVDTDKILYFETTVEPQYMGSIALCYSKMAKKEYEKWREENQITDPESEMPPTFPIPASFVKNPTWNKFRAQFLAKWVNEDAAAYRSIAGEKAYVAVDYLDANENVQYLRMGDPIEFLTHLTEANIIQVNWSWYFPNNTPNQKAYNRVWKVLNEHSRDWVVSEHMTFNGSDFVNYTELQLNRILENTLKQGTRFGWEFVNVSNNSRDNFSLYEDDWAPKKVIKSVDNRWEYWLERIHTTEP